MIDPRIRVRVTKHDDGSIKYELLHNGEKISEVSAVDIIEMVAQFSSALRYIVVQ